MASPIPFQLSGVLTYPPDDGEPNADNPFALNSSFNSEVKFKYELTGSGSKTIDFGSISTVGAKGILIELAADATAPIMVQINGGGVGGQVELSPGGFWAFGSPNPTVNGVLSMSLVYTAAATVRVRILG
jgi:hypothetical protein